MESPEQKHTLLMKQKSSPESFLKSDIKIQLSFGDLLEGDVGARHKGFMLNITKMLYPRSLIKGLAKILPIGLYLMIKVRK